MVSLSRSRSSSAMISPWNLGWLKPSTMSWTGPMVMRAPCLSYYGEGSRPAPRSASSDGDDARGSAPLSAVDRDDSRDARPPPRQRLDHDRAADGGQPVMEVGEPGAGRRE